MARKYYEVVMRLCDREVRTHEVAVKSVGSDHEGL